MAWAFSRTHTVNLLFAEFMAALFSMSSEWVSYSQLHTMHQVPIVCFYTDKMC